MSSRTNRNPEQPSDAGFRQRRGFGPQARPAQAPVVPVSDQRLRGLANLKWSFLFFMVGGALTFVPFVALIGSLFYIVALVFLIVGWRDLGRSTLAEAPRYKSTGSWLIYSIVIAVVVAVFGIVAVFFLFLSSALASGRGVHSAPLGMVQGHHLPEETRRRGLSASAQDRWLALTDSRVGRVRFVCGLFGDALHRCNFIPHADDYRGSRSLLWPLLLPILLWIRRCCHSRYHLRC